MPLFKESYKLKDHMLLSPQTKKEQIKYNYQVDCVTCMLITGNNR